MVLSRHPLNMWENNHQFSQNFPDSSALNRHNHNAGSWDSSVVHYSHSSAKTAVKISKLAGFTRGVALSILTYTCLGTVEEKKRKNVDPIPAAEETVGMIS